MKKSRIITIQKKKLIFRTDAGDILRYAQKFVEKNNGKVVVFDFSKVDFLSRSFVDELLNILKILKNRGINFRMINLKPELSLLVHNVQETKELIGKEMAAAGNRLI